MQLCKTEILLGLRKIYGITKIKAENNTITFPDGLATRNFYDDQDQQIGSTYYSVNINYNNEGKDNVINLLKLIDKEKEIWEKCEITSPYIFNMDKIDTKCIEKNWDVVGLDLAAPKKIAFLPDISKISIRMEIWIYKEYTKIILSQVGSDFLMPDFFDKLDFTTLNEVFLQFI
jgi:hypothetical protein